MLVGKRFADHRSAGNLLGWLHKNGFRPQTLGTKALGRQWHRGVAEFVCHAARSKVREARKRQTKGGAMMHRSRPRCIYPVAAKADLAHKLAESIWCLCTAFEIDDHLFLNDATSEDGAASSKKRWLIRTSHESYQIPGQLRGHRRPRLTCPRRRLPSTRVPRPWPDELRAPDARRDSVGHLSGG